MNIALRSTLVLVVMHPGIWCQAQTQFTDSLWRVWTDTTIAQEVREPALQALFSVTPSLTPNEAIARVLSTNELDTLSRSFAIQRARAKKVWGKIHLQDAAYRPVVNMMLQVSSEFDRLGSLPDKCDVNSILGEALTGHGQLRLAGTCLMQALSAAETLQDTVRMAIALRYIGDTYWFLGDVDRMEQTRLRALHLVEGRYPLMEYEILGRLCDPMTEGAPVTPHYVRYFERYKAMVADGRVPGDAYRSAITEAFVLMDAGECDSALAIFNQPNERIGWQVYLYWAKAQAHLCANRYREAVEAATLGRALGARYGYTTAAAKNLRALALGYEGLHDDAGALEAWKAYHAMRDSLSTSSAIASLAGAMLTSDFEKEQFADSLISVQHQVAGAAALQKERTRRNILFAAGLVAVIFGAISYSQRRRTQKALRRSDELLLNILPEEVADELKAKGHADAKHFDNVTILFTDFKGFTQASEKLSPQELVEELNTCFKAFDNIITARGIEKIKTIGDAYMCAGGLPVPSSSTPAGVVQAALEMQAFMVARKKERDAQGKPAFEMRVGIHTGPVVAGIVGVKKFAYDIWGDTVNTASRMESSGEVGQVNISEATYALVREQAGSLFHFTPRGKVQAKGKGEMEMYFVNQTQES